MKHIKKYKYKSIEPQTPQIGDYIQIYYPNTKDFGPLHEKGINFLNNNIGIVVNIEYNKNLTKNLTIKYDVPPELEDFFPFNHTKITKLEYIIAFGKTPEEVKLQIIANKYNL